MVNRCYKLVGRLLNPNYFGIYYFCAEENSFRLTPDGTWYPALDLYGELIETVQQGVYKPAHITEIKLGTGIIHPSFGMWTSSTPPEGAIYAIAGDCIGCGCNMAVDCVIPCPGDPGDFCCIPSFDLKGIADGLEIIANKKHE